LSFAGVFVLIGAFANRCIMSQLLEFYRLNATDSERRMLTDIWAWPHDDLEHHHDFIQWMFPLDEGSAFNADAPLVTDEDREAFGNESLLQAAMRRSLSVFLHFLGLAMIDGRVVKGENFEQRRAIWNHANHNWLRITRVLKSLRLLGFEKEAGALWNCLKALHENEGYVSEFSFEYWKRAMVENGSE